MCKSEYKCGTMVNKLKLLHNMKIVKTKKFNYLVKLADFSVKWRVFNSGFNGQKRLHAIWKALLKITLVDACFSMSFFKFKTSMQNATFFEKQHVIFVNWRSRSPLKKKHVRVNRNLASKYSRWGPYQYYQIIVSSVNVNQGIKR